MQKKQTKKPKYPKDIFVHIDCYRMLLATDKHESFSDGAEVAIYKFDRRAKVKRTVTVE